jgi:hypothetical protein
MRYALITNQGLEIPTETFHTRWAAIHKAKKLLRLINWDVRVIDTKRGKIDFICEGRRAKRNNG